MDLRRQVVHMQGHEASFVSVTLGIPEETVLSMWRQADADQKERSEPLVDDLDHLDESLLDRHEKTRCRGCGAVIFTKQCLACTLRGDLS